MGTGSVDGSSVLMEGVRGEYENHNQQKNDKEEDKGWFAILLLQLLHSYAATCGYFYSGPSLLQKSIRFYLYLKVLSPNPSKLETIFLKQAVRDSLFLQEV